jgi:NAD(P)H-dependent flavin oxidoreductase YrpB (nitropropane dioxygenase family)
MNNKKILLDQLKLPLIGSPMYIVSGPDLVIEQCKAGIIGSFPALNARPKEILDDWLIRISEELSAYKLANPNIKLHLMQSIKLFIKAMIGLCLIWSYA